MKKWLLYTAWALMFVMCAVLGFIPNHKGVNYWIFLVFALLFFVPPAILIYNAVKTDDVPELKLIRLISLISLGATLLALVLNFLSVSFTAAAGKIVYWVLIVVSSPMICGQIWLISLFLWGCLLSASWQEIFKRRKKTRK
jgi:hypothetical protein